MTRLLWTALVCWAASILYLSSLRPDELPDTAFLFWDKVNHFAAFAVGGWLAARALRTSLPRVPVVRTVVFAVILIAAFGVLDEAVQTFTPGRTGADISDWTADVMGACAGALVSLRRRPASRTSARSAALQHGGAGLGPEVI